MAPPKLPFGVSLGTKVHNFWNLRSPKKLPKTNPHECPKVPKSVPKWATLSLQMERTLQCGKLWENIPNLSSLSVQKVSRKLTHLSSPLSLLTICGELEDLNMAPSFPIYLLSISPLMHFLHVDWAGSWE